MLAKGTRRASMAAVAALVCCGLSAGTFSAETQPEFDLRIGGCGGVYFLAEPGELVIHLEKCDRNQSRRQTDLRAVLVAPDREVLRDITIEDDGLPPGKLGPPRRARMAVPVPRKGVYGLNITVSQDRYGEAMYWGFATNCRKFLIETARGHRDERHREPIVLYRPDRPGDVCFLPRSGTIRIEASGLPEAAEPLKLFGGQGRSLATMPVTSGRATHEIGAEVPRGAIPWRLHLPALRAVLEIDGLTRWERTDPLPDHCLWTPRAEAFFPFHWYRWILSPYQRTVYGQPGRTVEAVFEVHNNAPGRRSIRLDLEFPDSPWPVELSAKEVALGPGQSAKVILRGQPVAGQIRVCHLRATPAEDPQFSTYCTLKVLPGEPPAARPLTMPIVLQPYRHENEQFGYLPDYPVENAYYFDPANRPWTVASEGLGRWDGGRWVVAPIEIAAGPQAKPQTARPVIPKIAFDRQGTVYVLALVGGRIALVYSRDGGKSFAAAPLPGRQRGGSFDMEVFTGHNVLEGPPPILRYTQTAADPKRIWRRINDLELFLPRDQQGHVAIGPPVLVSRQCIGLAAHSGAPNSVVSRGDRVHIVWAEATDPEIKVPGVPTFVATYDRATRNLSQPALVGHGPPPNDVHNSPSITMDSKGFLHVVAGTHGRPFPYARSLAPNDSTRGWTAPVLAGEGLEQTYIGLVCGPDDTLHMAFRLWKRGQAPFPASHYATLAWQRKPAEHSWEPPRVLVVPPLSEYSVYYHRLTIDRKGRLFLSYDYWSTYWHYRNDHRGRRRVLLVSPDGGKTWKLAETRDLAGL